MNLIYFSSVSENTHRFVAKLGVAASELARIPLLASAEPIKATEEYILVVPTSGGASRKGADVPKQVIRFLNDPDNRSLLRGVIASGNTNFGSDFCRAGEIISQKCGVPVLYRLELLGTTEDVEAVRTIMESI